MSVAWLVGGWVFGVSLVGVGEGGGEGGGESVGCIPWERGIVRVGHVSCLRGELCSVRFLL